MNIHTKVHVKWSGTDCYLLQEYKEKQFLAWATIAYKLNRSVKACKSKYYQLKIQQRKGDKS